MPSKRTAQRARSEPTTAEQLVTRLGSATAAANAAADRLERATAGAREATHEANGVQKDVTTAIREWKQYLSTAVDKDMQEKVNTTLRELSDKTVAAIKDAEKRIWKRFDTQFGQIAETLDTLRDECRHTSIGVPGHLLPPIKEPKLRGIGLIDGKVYEIGANESFSKYVESGQLDQEDADALDEYRQEIREGKHRDV